MNEELWSTVKLNEAIEVAALSFGILTNIDSPLVLDPIQVPQRPES